MNIQKSNKVFTRDDFAIWPDGTWATLHEVWAGDYHFMSDDYEMVQQDDVKRLTELGIPTDGALD
jgi:hypothetical protein